MFDLEAPIEKVISIQSQLTKAMCSSFRLPGLSRSALLVWFVIYHFFNLEASKWPSNNHPPSHQAAVVFVLHLLVSSFHHQGAGFLDCTFYSVNDS